MAALLPTLVSSENPTRGECRPYNVIRFTLNRNRLSDRGTKFGSKSRLRSSSALLILSPPKSSKVAVGGAQFINSGRICSNRSTARQVTKSTSGATNDSKRSGITWAPALPIKFNASRRNTAFFCDDSISVARISRRAIMQGMIGKPPPDPMSTTRASLGRYFTSSRDSSTWRVANSLADVGATRCRREFQELSS